MEKGGRQLTQNNHGKDPDDSGKSNTLTGHHSGKSKEFEHVTELPFIINDTHFHPAIISFWCGIIPTLCR